MSVSMSKSDPHTAEVQLRTAILPLRPDIPPNAITVMRDEHDLLSAAVYGVEQSLQATCPLLRREVVDRFAHYHRVYNQEQTSALLTTLRTIAPKAGLSISPGSLKLTELPAAVLVLTLNDQAVAASEDPLHLLSQAILNLKAAQKPGN